MTIALSKKRKIEDGIKGKTPRPAKQSRKQTVYSSGSDNDSASKAAPIEREKEEDGGVMLGEEENSSEEVDDGPDDQSDEDSNTSADENSDSEDSLNHQSRQKKRKRDDPSAFASSISKILSSKLTTAKRSDPVLSRSKTAAQASQELSEARLEARARHKLREEKKAALEKGRVKDVLGLQEGPSERTSSVAETLERERRLRKTAQRGVVKLFNAVRAAQVKGEEAAREAREKGVVGVGRREEKVNEMSKKGFLDLIASGGSKSNKDMLEET
ncbi:MAG: hypothetical protein M1817_000516 [Caeruleum heppii]|nr:MAG: hypothetical protein M1817_000516 [Caeruleum heppii]